MLNSRIGSPEIDALLRRLFREIHRLEPMEAVMLTSAVMRRLAEHLHDLGVEVELSTKSSPD